MLQSLTRNSLASPDTLAVTAGSYLAVVAVAAFGLSIPLWASGGVAFVGGLAAAVLVLGLSGAGTSTTRILLAGSAVALALQSATATLLILFSQNTTSLFAWGSGSLSQLGLTAFLYAAPVVVAATVAGLLLSRRLDLMALGDDTASVLGVPVRSTRFIGIVLAVVLTAAAVTLAGPIGFVGLCAPVIVRLLGRVRARAEPACGADPGLRPGRRAGGDRGGRRGAGPVRCGGGHRHPDRGRHHDRRRGRAGAAGPTAPGRRTDPAAAAAGVGLRSRRRFALVLVGCAALAAGTLLLGLLAGHTWLRTGDIGLWLSGQGPPLVRFALDERAPRVVAAMVAGAAIALAGTLTQATCRNPLAEPGLLGITAGAGLGAVIVVTGGAMGTEGASNTVILAAAMIGALAAFALVYGLTWRGGLNADRLVLIGIGVWYGASALTTLLLVRANPWDTPRIYTWLSGTTYGRTWPQVVPVAVALVARPAGGLRGPAGVGPAGPGRGHAAAGRRPPGTGAADHVVAGSRAGRDIGRRGRRRRIPRPGRPARGQGTGRQQARPGDRGVDAAGRGVAGPGRHLRPVGDRPGTDPRRTGRGPDRRALLRLPAGAFADSRLIRIERMTGGTSSACR